MTYFSKKQEYTASSLFWQTCHNTIPNHYFVG
jgi:hypothetical protein